MKTFTLPDDIFKDKKQLASYIIIYNYSSNRDSFKEKSILNRNVFSLVISGNKTMHFAEKTVNASDKEIHLLSEGNCIASVSLSKQKPFESVLIFFDNQVLLDFFATHSVLIDKLKKKSRQTNEPYVEFAKDQFLVNYIQSLLLSIQKGKLSEPMKQVKLHELLLYLLENHTATLLSFKYSDPATDIEARFKKIIEANKYNNLTLDELSFLCNMSTSTFKRMFKKIYGDSPSVWLNEQKMNFARKLLSEQNEKPSKIWFKLGFETHTGFNKSFKKHFGDSPKAFVKKVISLE